MKKLSLIILTLFAFASGLLFAFSDSDTLPTRRPWGKDPLLCDAAGILQEIEESLVSTLESLRRDYAVEVAILTTPKLEPAQTIESLTTRLFEDWHIGRDCGGRGILILYVQHPQQLKIEISYSLEDVFTDAFCGYIENKQIMPYYLSGQVSIGVVALLEEIAARVQIKQAGQYTLADISEWDQALLSGGAGAKRRLQHYQQAKIIARENNYPPGKTPEAAWKTLVASWRDKVRNPNLTVYTEMTKLAYRDFVNLPDARFDEYVRTYSGKPFEIIKNDKYAVVYFGKEKGWENAPFLFCKAPLGWQYDIVYQRKYVRMGRNPHWGIERGDHPYMDLLSHCPYWMQQDIPLEAEDIYGTEQDRQTSQKIKLLEEDYRHKPDHFETVMELGRLYTITSLSPAKRLSLLKRAKQLNPGAAAPYKYLGIVHLDAFYQFEGAAKEMETYVDRQPDDRFGHNFLGYLYLCQGRYTDAIRELDKTLQRSPHDIYALCKLSRAYTMLYLKKSVLDPRRSSCKAQAIQMFEKAQRSPFRNPRRIAWLQSFLKKKKIL